MCLKRPNKPNLPLWLSTGMSGFPRNKEFKCKCCYTKIIFGTFFVGLVVPGLDLDPDVVDLGLEELGDVEHHREAHHGQLEGIETCWVLGRFWGRSGPVGVWESLLTRYLSTLSLMALG